MNSLLILALCACAVYAAPPYSGADKDAVVLRSDIDNIGVDRFNYAYETSNGIAASEQGELTNPGTDNEAIVVRGQYTYTGPDGVQYSVTYTADENGFQPQGAHLPVAPK